MPTSQWPGLVTAASPFAIPPTAAVEQTNLACNVPGQVYVRGGMRKVAVVGGSPDILDCFPYEKDGKSALISMLPDGRLVFQRSPAYGWQSKVPYEPDLGGSPLVTTGYTQRFVEGPDDAFDPPDPELDPNPGGGVDDGGGCSAALVGGTALTDSWTYFLDVESCDPSSPDPVADGGSASTAVDCSQSIAFVACGDDPRPPQGATVPTPPRDLVVAFGAGSASLSWTAPVSNGGAPVLDYEWGITTGTSEDPLALPSTPSAPSVVWGATSATATWIPGQGGGSVLDYDFEQQTLALPGAPTNLSAPISNPPSPNTTWYWSLGWTNPSTANGPLTGFRVYRNEALWLAPGYPGGVFPPNTLGVALENSQWASGDTARVSALNAAGEGPKSAPVTLSGSATVPGAPEIIDAYTEWNGVNYDVVTKWTAPAGNGGAAITQYRVYYNGGSVAAATASASPAQFLPSTNPNGYSDYVRVSAVNAVGEGPLSDPFVVQV